ncbi:MAG TPA: macro domain-containing protein [Solirubrobacteraceae bacterium]|jgi:O-acetyl-ADP-ribose deacetylase (regulator of RNase III)
MTSTSIEVLDTDITTLALDAIANAANTRLAHGGGVARAIVRRGGQQIQTESNALAPIALGEAVLTLAGALPCRFVIHAATMEPGGPTSAEVIRAAARSTLRCAESHGVRSLALVAFGTGVGGFPLQCAAEIEMQELERHLRAGSTLERVVFCVKGQMARSAFERALAAERSLRIFG